MWMLVLLASLIAVAPLLWCGAAFLLRLGHTGRLVATIAVPGLAAAAWVWTGYLDRRIPGEQGWDTIFALLSLAGGGFVALAALPIWFFVEERLGWRAR